MPKYAQMTTGGFVHTQSDNPYLKVSETIKELPDDFLSDVNGTMYRDGHYYRPAVINPETGKTEKPEELVL